MEYITDIRSLSEFHSVLENNRTWITAQSIDQIGEEIIANGCREPLSNHRAGPSALSAGTGWREGLAFNGISSRVRAVMYCIEQAIEVQHLAAPRIFAAEGLTAFALRMRGIFPRFLGSEFTMNLDQREWLDPIPCEDLQSLSLKDSHFDIVSTNEVLEHVPSIDKALAELCRVLRPGGWHFGTVPFLYFAEKGEVRTGTGPNSELIHFMEPQYHGDPMNDGGVLVFELPAWDLVARARAAGFSDAFMRFIVSSGQGILSEHIGGVLVFCCQK